MSTVYTNADRKKNETNPSGRNTIAKKDGGIEAPKNVISTEAGARAVIQRIARAHNKRVFTYERIQGLIDGNPPYNPARMRQAGVNDMTNVNWKDAAAIFKSYTLAFWSLFNDVRFIADFVISLADDKGLNAYWSQVISEEWDSMMKMWPGFKKEMEFHQGELVKIGLNAIVFFDEHNWQFKPINFKKVYIPDETPNNIDDISCFAVERTFTAQFLYQTWEKFKDSKDKEWNAKALEKILFETANTSDANRSFQLTGFDDMQQRIRNNDIQFEELYNDQLHFVSVFQKEYDGKISHIMIHIDIATEECPYFVSKQYDQMSQCVHFFTLEPGEEYLHGAKGLGQAVYSAIEATTRLECSLIDQATRAGSLIMKSGATRGTDARVIKFIHGGVIDVGEAEIQQNQLGSNINGSISVAQYFKQKIFANNNMSGLDPQAPDRERSTRQVQMQATKEARVQKNTVSHYYDQLDGFFSEVVRKQLNCKSGQAGYEYVKLWKESCIERDVPEEIFDMMKDNLSPNGLPRYFKVFASRASGSGSQIADQTEVQSCMSILPTLGERGRKAVLQDYITAYRGYRYVSRYFPPEDQQQEPVADDTIASLENNQLSDGKQVVVSPDNNHAVHSPAHIRMLNEAMQEYTQTPEPPFELLDKVDKIFAAGGPHLTRHLMYLSQDPTRQSLMEQLRAQWAILANFGDMIKNNAQRARQAQQDQMQRQSQAVDKVQGELQVKQMKTEGELSIKADKMAADVQMGRERDQNKFLLSRQALTHKSWIDSMVAQNKLAKEAREDLGLNNNEV